MHIGIIAYLFVDDGMTEQRRFLSLPVCVTINERQLSVPVCLFKQTTPQVPLISHAVFAECQETGKYTEIKRNCSDVRKKNEKEGDTEGGEKSFETKSNKVNEEKRG